MGILAWIVVGLVAGVLASLVMGGTGYGIIGDIIIGITDHCHRAGDFFDTPNVIGVEPQLLALRGTDAPDRPEALQIAILQS